MKAEAHCVWQDSAQSLGEPAFPVGTVMHLTDHDLRQPDDACLEGLTPEQARALPSKALADLQAARERLAQDPSNSSRPLAEHTQPAAATAGLNSYHRGHFSVNQGSRSMAKAANLPRVRRACDGADCAALGIEATTGGDGDRGRRIVAHAACCGSCASGARARCR
jgi:hypothetical protein